MDGFWKERKPQAGIKGGCMTSKLLFTLRQGNLEGEKDNKTWNFNPPCVLPPCNLGHQEKKNMNNWFWLIHKWNWRTILNWVTFFWLSIWDCPNIPCTAERWPVQGHMYIVGEQDLVDFTADPSGGISTQGSEQEHDQNSLVFYIFGISHDPFCFNHQNHWNHPSWSPFF